VVFVNIESCHFISYEQSYILYPSVNTNMKYRQKVTGDDQYNFDETYQPLNLYSPFVKYSETCLR
jgi:hypothetical protein